MLITDSVKQQPAEKKSKQKGLYWHKKSGRMKQGDWEAKVRVDGKYKSLGRFINEQDAIDSIKNYQALFKNNCE